MLNAIGCPAVQGVPLSDLAPKGFAYPIATWTTSQFLTARAVPPDEFIGFLEGMTLTKKLPTLADVANTAVFPASDHAAAMSGAVAAGRPERSRRSCGCRGVRAPTA
jgi:hypothetical protein